MTTTLDSSDGCAEHSAVDDQTGGRPLCTREQPLRLLLQHPVPEVCVVGVHGELDMLTAPLLDECLREQIGHALPHLVVDLEGVSFLGTSGLSSLLRARELAQTAGVDFCLATLAKKAVRESLAVASVLPVFRCYPTLAQVLPELRDRTGARAPTDDPSDADLVSQLGAGDQRAMGLLYGRYARPAYSLARRICIGVEIAEDVLQEVFLTVWRESTCYDPARGRFATWLFTLVHHKSVDAVRRESVVRRWTVPNTVDGEAWSAPHGPGADEAVIGSVLAAQVRDALGRLSVEQRQALTLSYFGGYTHDEIAALVDVPLGTVKSRLYAGVRRLRILLGPLVCPN
ncbi:MAG: sigma-70 family RNA polymerase sigma factor [Pseudonocardiaceae bacterium]